jgi:hypothetical protein
MFYILGSDGSRLGPLDAPTLRNWIAQQRVNAQTQIQQEGSAEWRPASAFPEFASSFSTNPLPPPLPPAIAATGPSRSPRPRTSGLAITAIVFAFLGPCTVGIGDLVAIVTGIVALRKIKRSAGQLTGKGLAVTAIVISALTLVLLPVALGVLLPFLAQQANSHRTPDTCERHIQRVARALQLAADANEGKFPAAANWCEAALPNLQTQDLLRCPSRGRLRCGYAYNRNVAGRKMTSVPPDTVLLIESSRGWNATAGPDDPVPPPPHDKMYSVAFADGTTREVDAAELATLRWEP